ncbi:Alkaline phosphatase [Dokdonella koreensis DS-123]|uniref:Alkaline phosphatase n=1 Tax=Dokdonella koreensis DS-123 TaxID=1300342 RepID=A0A161HIK7_9GAMM|nr:Alkaline phosphatase [Dokdonella koreensis DS-123]
MAPEAASTPSIPFHATATARPRGGVPELRFEQANMDFGVVDTGSSGRLLTAVLINDSDSVPATLLHFESDPTFPLMHQFGSCEGFESLEPGASCSVRIKFAPTTPGPTSGTLTAVSAEGVETTLPLNGVGGDDHILYAQPHDWEAMPSFWLRVATAYPKTPEYTSDMAEDFLVEGAGWVIQKVGIEAKSLYSPPSLPAIEFIFLADMGGLPGTEPLCPESTLSVAYWEPPQDENRIETVLTPPCTLPPGHYWLQARFRAEAYSPAYAFGWGLQYVLEPDEPPPVHLNPPVWRQPGGGSGYPGCFDWTPLSPPACGLEDWLPWQTAYGAVFWLVGQAASEPIFEDGFDLQ